MTYLVDDLVSSVITKVNYATALGHLRQAKPIGVVYILAWLIFVFFGQTIALSHDHLDPGQQPAHLPVPT